MIEPKKGVRIVLTARVYDDSPALGSGPGASMTARTKTVSLRGRYMRSGELGWLCEWDDGHRPTWEDPKNIKVLS